MSSGDFPKRGLQHADTHELKGAPPAYDTQMDQHQRQNMTNQHRVQRQSSNVCCAFIMMALCAINGAVLALSIVGIIKMPSGTVEWALSLVGIILSSIAFIGGWVAYSWKAKYDARKYDNYQI